MPSALKPLCITGNSPGGLRHGCTGFSVATGEVCLGLVDGLFALATSHPVCVCAPPIASQLQAPITAMERAHFVCFGLDGQQRTGGV